VSGRERGPVKGLHDAVVVGGKGEVDVLGHGLAGDQREGRSGSGEVHAPGRG
jgi:hypothetical protein